MKRIKYYKRLFETYISKKESHIKFWKNIPEINKEVDYSKIGKYYLTLSQKGNYSGPFDSKGIPLLNYLGDIGVQYNPTAIAQYALANYNLAQNPQDIYFQKFLLGADWLANNLRVSPEGVYLWPYNFDFYIMKAPWYSGLAQGEGLSVLVRAYAATGKKQYQEAGEKVYRSLCRTTAAGGVLYRQGEDCWIEEVVCDPPIPPLHILNGFISALWGIHDYVLLTQSQEAKDLFVCCSNTVLKYLPQYDMGFWSLYKLMPKNKIKFIASPNYHLLHIAQLRILYSMTGEKKYSYYADTWENYENNSIYKVAAIIYKILSKLTE